MNDYPAERIKQAAEGLPDAEENARVFIHDEKFEAVIEFFVVTEFDVKHGKKIHFWKLGGVYPFFATIKKAETEGN
jgi:hypothetical protein